jgi:hypothetical protein
MALDGMAFNRDETSRDMLIIEADGSEGIYLAEFDLEKLRAYRRMKCGAMRFESRAFMVR